jgi:hypothetical protein
MTSQELIKETIENASEWLEMTPNPTAMVVGILANKVIQLQDHIEYLEKRLHHVSR